MTAANTDPTVSLGQDALALLVSPDIEPDVMTDARFHNYEAVVNELIQTPAKTVSGLVLKLKVVHAEFDGGETHQAYPLLDSIIEDAERLAGGTYG